jgi:hypothetical protein
MLRRLLALTALAAALVVAGCGDDKKGGGTSATTKTQATTATTSTANAAYKAQVRTILTSVGSAGTALGTAAKASKSPADLARALEDFKASVLKAADALAAITPPAAAAEGHKELEQVLREIAEGVQPSIDAARAGDKAKFRSTFSAYQRKLDSEYRQRLSAAGEKIDRALAGK